MQTRYRPDLDSVQTIQRILQKPFRVQGTGTLQSLHHRFRRFQIPRGPQGQHPTPSNIASTPSKPSPNLWVTATYVLIIFRSNGLHATGGNAQRSRQRCAFTLISAEMHNTLPKSKIFAYALLKALRVGNPDHIIFPKQLFKTNSFRQWCVLRVVT